MGAAIRKGYSQLYERNEYAHDLDKKKMEGLVVEITGLEAGHATTRAIVGTFEALKSFADFDAALPADSRSPATAERAIDSAPLKEREPSDPHGEDLKLNLSYTINLVLPKTDDVAVFNAIFKSLRDNLLKK